MPTMTPGTVQYVAKIQNVTEVILIGRADLDFWQAHLRSAQLRPCVMQDQAYVQISATDARWRGFHFREFTLSIGVGDADDTDQPRASYLAHAFNSLPLFAWMEQTFFRTPYYPGAIDVQLAPSAGLAVTVNGTVAFKATMSDQAVKVGETDEDWFGPIHLPDRSAQPIGNGEVFYAHLSGRTDRYAFSPADSCAITPTPTASIFQRLRDSQFVPREWRLRSAASHAKSKTYRRTV
jgi:hypothetical protein